MSRAIRPTTATAEKLRERLGEAVIESLLLAARDPAGG
jgi:hypothetical protein